MEAESSTAAQQHASSQTPLLLDQIRALITAASAATSVANLHPYASLPDNGPASLKGKGKAVDQHPLPSLEAQIEAVRQLGAALDQARAALGSMNGDWSRLSRSLREM